MKTCPAMYSDVEISVLDKSPADLSTSNLRLPLDKIKRQQNSARPEIMGVAYIDNLLEELHKLDQEIDAPRTFSSPQQFLHQLHRITHDMESLVRGIQSSLLEGSHCETVPAATRMKGDMQHRPSPATSGPLTTSSHSDGTADFPSVPLAPSSPQDSKPLAPATLTTVSGCAFGTPLSSQAVNEDHIQIVQDVIDSHRKALSNLQVALRSAEKQFSTNGEGEDRKRQHQHLRQSLSSVCKKLLATPQLLAAYPASLESRDKAPAITVLVSPSHTDNIASSKEDSQVGHNPARASMGGLLPPKELPLSEVPTLSSGNSVQASSSASTGQQQKPKRLLDALNQAFPEEEDAVSSTPAILMSSTLKPMWRPPKNSLQSPSTLSPCPPKTGPLGRKIRSLLHEMPTPQRICPAVRQNQTTTSPLIATAADIQQIRTFRPWKLGRVGKVEAPLTQLQSLRDDGSCEPDHEQRMPEGLLQGALQELGRAVGTGEACSSGSDHGRLSALVQLLLGEPETDGVPVLNMENNIAGGQATDRLASGGDTNIKIGVEVNHHPAFKQELQTPPESPVAWIMEAPAAPHNNPHNNTPPHPSSSSVMHPTHHHATLPFRTQPAELFSPGKRSRLDKGYSSPSHALRQLHLQQQYKNSASKFKERQSPISVPCVLKSPPTTTAHSLLKKGHQPRSPLSPSLQNHQMTECKKLTVSKGSQRKAAGSRMQATTPPRSQLKSSMRGATSTHREEYAIFDHQPLLEVEAAATSQTALARPYYLQAIQHALPGEDSQDLTGFEDEEGSPSIFGGKVSAQRAVASQAKDISSKSPTAARVWDDSSDESCISSSAYLLSPIADLRAKYSAVSIRPEALSSKVPPGITSCRSQGASTYEAAAAGVKAVSSAADSFFPDLSGLAFQPSSSAFTVGQSSQLSSALHPMIAPLQLSPPTAGLPVAANQQSILAPLEPLTALPAAADAASPGVVLDIIETWARNAYLEVKSQLLGSVLASPSMSPFYLHPASSPIPPHTLLHPSHTLPEALIGYAPIHMKLDIAALSPQSSGMVPHPERQMGSTRMFSESSAETEASITGKPDAEVGHHSGTEVLLPSQRHANVEQLPPGLEGAAAGSHLHQGISHFEGAWVAGRVAEDSHTAGARWGSSGGANEPEGSHTAGARWGSSGGANEPEGSHTAGAWWGSSGGANEPEGHHRNLLLNSVDHDLTHRHGEGGLATPLRACNNPADNTYMPHLLAGDGVSQPCQSSFQLLCSDAHLTCPSTTVTPGPCDLNTSAATASPSTGGSTLACEISARCSTDLLGYSTPTGSGHGGQHSSEEGDEDEDIGTVQSRESKHPTKLYPEAHLLQGGDSNFEFHTNQSLIQSSVLCAALSSTETTPSALAPALVTWSLNSKMSPVKNSQHQLQQTTSPHMLPVLEGSYQPAPTDFWRMRLLQVLQKHQQQEAEAPRRAHISCDESSPPDFALTQSAAGPWNEDTIEMGQKNATQIEPSAVPALAPRKKLGRMEAGTWTLVLPHTDLSLMGETQASATKEPELVEIEGKAKDLTRGWRAKLGIMRRPKERVDRGVVEREIEVQKRLQKLEGDKKNYAPLWKKIAGRF
ncbi:hypothetical protein CEUSTIGMA_g1387.t1 [Chlamydomonas eustigma]|uniref:Uncharacterized protein n=1 Tax=Chlamydomonas eustigma TaxID=1157962 RepID=A0A250WSW9_9CHLO|nr:hypothetical protein CEUSTIGMA_g1387.t1 [Chlamydomonas eustigma]|eukprot:GAX73937.1 hypothetical protein CEUSTIGMA_g1387.t1 [Chlamydomonas eustigma]